MSTATRAQRRYDHRLKQLVRAPGKIDLARESGVPRSTAYGWLTESRSDVVTFDVLDDIAQLQREVVLFRRRNARLVAILRLIITVMKAAEFSLNRVRLARPPSSGQSFESKSRHFAACGERHIVAV